jgi:hypothetical protein
MCSVYLQDLSIHTSMHTHKHMHTPIRCAGLVRADTYPDPTKVRMHPRKPAFKFNAYRSSDLSGQAAVILARGRQGIYMRYIFCLHMCVCVCVCVCVYAVCIYVCTHTHTHTHTHMHAYT